MKDWGIYFSGTFFSEDSDWRKSTVFYGANWFNHENRFKDERGLNMKVFLRK